MESTCIAKRKIRLGESRVQPVGEHLASSGDNFFGRLADEHQRAGPAILVRGQVTGHADEIGDVDVVPAGVHHSGFAAVFLVTSTLEA